MLLAAWCHFLQSAKRPLILLTAFLITGVSNADSFNTKSRKITVLPHKLLSPSTISVRCTNIGPYVYHRITTTPIKPTNKSGFDTTECTNNALTFSTPDKQSVANRDDLKLFDNNVQIMLFRNIGNYEDGGYNGNSNHHNYRHSR